MSVQVTNTGSVDADDVVLGFLEPPGAGDKGVPLQTLFAFERVHVKAGQARPRSLSSLSHPAPRSLSSPSPRTEKKPQPTPLARAGQTVTAFLYPALTDFAVADADGERAALPGRYTVRFGLREAAAHGMGFAEAALSAVAGPLPAPVEQAG